MLYYDRIDISAGVDAAKSNNSKECMIFHYWFFKYGFKYQGFVCSGRYDFLILVIVLL